MKLVKALMLSVVLLAPAVAFAGVTGEIIGDSVIGDFDDVAPAVPEPSGALLMGVALATVALTVRRQRK